MESKVENALKEHEKLIAFLFLGFSVLILAILSYFWPPEDKSGAQRIIDSAMGGLLLALGAVCNALFRIANATEQQAIAEKTATAIGVNARSSGPLPVVVDQSQSNPIPVSETEPAAAGGELPSHERIA